MDNEPLYVIRRRLNKSEGREEYKLLGEIERGSSIVGFLKDNNDVISDNVIPYDIIIVIEKDLIHNCHYNASYAFIIKSNGKTSANVAKYYRQYEDDSYDESDIVGELESRHGGPGSKIVKAVAAVIRRSTVSSIEFKGKADLINIIDDTVVTMSIPGYEKTGDGRSVRFHKELIAIDANNIYVTWLIKSIRLWLDASEGFDDRLLDVIGYVFSFYRVRGVDAPSTKQIIKDFISLREYMLMAGDLK